MTEPKHARHDEVLSVAFLIEQGAAVIGGIAPVEREAGHDRLTEESSTYHRAAHAASRAIGLLWFAVGFGLSACLALTLGWPGVAIGLSSAGCLVSGVAVAAQRRHLYRLLDSLIGADLAARQAPTAS